MQYVLRMASLAKNRRPGRTGYSPRALVYGHDEKHMASGLGRSLDKPFDAVITRQDPAHVRRMYDRTLAVNAVIDLDCSQRWKEASTYPTIPAEATYYLPGEQVFFWERGLQARLKPCQEKRHAVNHSRPARRTDIWYGLAIVIGHEYDGEARRDSYWIYVDGNGALVSGLHRIPAEQEYCLAQEAYNKLIKHSLQGSPQDTFDYLDLRGDSNAGQVSLQGQVFEHIQMPGIEEDTPLYHPSTMLQPRPPPLSQSTTTYHGVPSTAGVPRTYGPTRPPLRRADPSRVARTVGEPEPSPNHTPPPMHDDPDPALFFTATAHKGRRHALHTTMYTIR